MPELTAEQFEQKVATQKATFIAKLEAAAKKPIDDITVDWLDKRLPAKGRLHRSFEAEIRKKRKKVEADIAKVADIETRYEAWVLAGKPADALCSVMGMVGFVPEEDPK